jgi:methylenetetrahydrofolate--tRNA-(uracil-5-)-methyltransferase
MNVNFGLFPPLGRETARGAQKQALSARALADLDAWIGGTMHDAAE